MHDSAAARPLAILALPALLFWLSGCAANAPAGQGENRAALGSTEISALTDAMAERARALQSLQTSAIMDFTNGADHVKAREDIALRRPASMRVEASSPFGVALIIVAQDSRLQIFDPSKNTLMNGTADAATLARFARIPMAPHDAVSLLMGIVPEAQTISSPPRVSTEGDMTVLTYDTPDHSQLEVGFQQTQLAMLRKRTPAGAIDFEVHYGDYHDIGGVMFAYKVDAEFPAAATHVSFVYKRPIVNGTIADSLFTLTPGPGAKQVDLGMSNHRGVPIDG